jgi:hypothetical protein
MTATELLPLLDKVQTRGSGKWLSRCPAHRDNSPSLAIAEGERALLLKCWAGCTVGEITDALRVRISDLFYHDTSSTASDRQQASRQRAIERAARHAAYEAEGRRMDALRQAECLVRTANGLCIDGWSNQQLDEALERLGAAYALLESEAV